MLCGVNVLAHVVANSTAQLWDSGVRSWPVTGLHITAHLYGLPSAAFCCSVVIIGLRSCFLRFFWALLPLEPVAFAATCLAFWIAAFLMSVPFIFVGGEGNADITSCSARYDTEINRRVCDERWGATSRIMER